MKGNKLISVDYYATKNIKLVKDNGETHLGTQYKFVEWNEQDKFKQFHDAPQIGYSVMIDPHYAEFTWLTTVITEIESDTTDKDVRCIAFKTKNSSYKLYITQDESNTN
jgi:hypothetical protein